MEPLSAAFVAQLADLDLDEGNFADARAGSGARRMRRGRRCRRPAWQTADDDYEPARRARAKLAELQG
ncbi:MAG: hypothetical protein F4123_02400 [Gemmatimonadetes bacterium]|nr:hypothetical protein [Gemmatimonadota bacterium]MYB98895.1 hypothetical protein [Gemmatimonadota bacterium]MYI45241.1 hypothetical protein [Gemmatimonadota bacterium]